MAISKHKWVSTDGYKEGWLVDFVVQAKRLRRLFLIRREAVAYEHRLKTTTDSAPPPKSKAP